MKTYKSVEKLIEDSMQVYTGMLYTYGTFEFELNIDESLKNEGCYSIRDYQNCVIGFIYNGAFYVTPYTNGAYLFVDNHFENRGFDVPFSDCDLPKNSTERNRWNNLLAEAKRDKISIFESQCVEWCISQGIEQIDSSILDQCFMIPESGVEYIRPYYQDTFYPFISVKPDKNSPVYLDFKTKDFLGTFSESHGVVVFVSSNGHTYISRGQRIIDILLESGYRGKGLFVPFSNGDERIIDSELKSLWESTKNIE